MVFITPTGFNSFHEYWQFAWAREFRDINTHERVMYAKSRLEKLGDVLVYPVMKGADYTMRNYKEPLVLLTTSLTAILGVTILFYPAEVMRVVEKVIPFAQLLKPWMIKAALYTTLQLTILGITIRTLGRLDPKGDLWKKWDQGTRDVMPIPLGTTIVRVP